MPPLRRFQKPKERLQLDSAQIAHAVRNARYTGSPEHKTAPSFAGMLRPKATNSICPPSLSRQGAKLKEWLRDAIRRGWIGAPLLDGFPRHAWYKDGDSWYEARLTNQSLGEYKGWPISVSELPAWVRDGN